MISKSHAFRDPRNPIGVLILLAAFAAAAGCSTANTTGGDVVVNHVNASGNSVPGWVTPTGGSHANSATLDYIANGGSSSCTECHGSDLAGGISRVSCFGNTAGCHHDPIPNWITAAVHGATAKQAPGSSGFASCQICHGRDFSGGGAKVSCFTCHEVAPHPASPWLGPTYTHADTNTSNATVCAQCHFPESSNNPANHPPTPAAAGTPPGCFNNTLCHGTSQHPAGWAQSSQHGPAAKAQPSAFGGFAYCQTCHGDPNATPPANFEGGTSGVSCYLCHEVDAPHPDGATWMGNVTPSHRNTNQGQANVDVCAQCHRSETPGTVGCFNNTLCH
jgi:hypothetical protein